MAHLDFEAPLVELEERIAALRELTGAGAPDAEDIEAQIQNLQAQANELQRELYADLDVWKKVQLSRHPDRPYLRDYAALLFEDFVELHGDRVFRDDPAIISGFARFESEIVAVVGHQKGRSAKDKAHRNFGMAHPEGYRKAVRVMKLAEQARRPVLTFIDTPGAYPGLGAEERGQAEAIGHAIEVMSRLRVPVISTPSSSDCSRTTRKPSGSSTRWSSSRPVAPTENPRWRPGRWAKRFGAISTSCGVSTETPWWRSDISDFAHLGLGGRARLF
jgi:acetyl-CoA carboxylase carboxyl transferase subunit alpha